MIVSTDELRLVGQLHFTAPNSMIIAIVNFKARSADANAGGACIHYFDEMLLLYQHDLAANTPFNLSQYRWYWGYPGDTQPGQNQLVPREWDAFADAVIEHVAKPMADLLARDLRMDITACLWRMDAPWSGRQYCSTEREKVA